MATIRFNGVLRICQNSNIKLKLRNFHTSSICLTDASTAAGQTASSGDASTSLPVTSYYDIVISGGGMVGAAMASVLGQDELFRGLKIAVIETLAETKKYQTPPNHSNRVSALSKASVDLFKQLDSFEFIESQRYCPVKHMQVWDACSDSMINFQTNDDNLAVIVENDVIQASLYSTVKTFQNINVLYSTQIKDINYENDQFVKIKIDDKNFINTKLLIGSDGHNSFVRKKADIGVTQIDYDQFAIVATMKLSQRENHTAWQRFLPTGPLALLPLNDEYSSLVWSVRKGAAKELMKLNDEEFIDKLNHAFVDESYKNPIATNVDKMLDGALDYISTTFRGNNVIAENVRQLPPKVEACVSGSRAFFPLTYCHANSYISNRIALIGDAAHRIHPLAGQGVNLGFGDVLCLADKLRENIKSGAELGSRIYLEQYESDRLKDAYPKIMFIHFLNSLYTNASVHNQFVQTPIVLLRSLGLTLSNRISFVKNFFANEAIK